MLEKYGYSYSGPEYWIDQEEVHCATNPKLYRESYTPILDRLSDYLLTGLELQGLEPEDLSTKLMDPKRVLEHRFMGLLPLDSIYYLSLAYKTVSEVMETQVQLKTLFALPHFLPWDKPVQRMEHVFSKDQISNMAPTTTIQFYDEEDGNGIARLGKIQLFTVAQKNQLPLAKVLSFRPRS